MADDVVAFFVTDPPVAGTFRRRDALSARGVHASSGRTAVLSSFTTFDDRAM
jgi:hypothetical protein